MVISNWLTSKDPIRNWLLLGILVLSIIGSFMHFVYQWSGNSIIIGIFAPTNESVWEHLKMTFWPMLICWFIGYYILKKRNTISVVQWFVSCSIAELVCPLVIVSFYYTYTGALGIKSLILNIFSLFLGVAVGQCMGLHVYKHAKLHSFCLYIAIALLIVAAIAFTVFTFAPPPLPLFKTP